MSERTNADIIRIVNKWQTSAMLHDLTCGADSRHASLAPVERDGKIVLECPTCGAVQERIPDFVLQSEAALDFSAGKWAEAKLAAERRHARQDDWFARLASVLGGGALGGLWFGTVGGFVGIAAGGLVGWFATRRPRTKPEAPPDHQSRP